MFPMPFHKFVVTLFLLFTYFYAFTAEEADCSKRSRSNALQTIVLFDVSPENQQDFQQQKDRLVKTLRDIDRYSAGRKRFYELITFHRSPMEKLQSASIDQIIEQIDTLSMVTIRETSPAKALNEARTVVEKMPQAQSVILLVHDGHNTDLASETLTASARVSKKVPIFAIAGGKTPPALAKLAEYTGERRRVFAFEQDNQKFLDALDEEIEFCPLSALAPSTTENNNLTKEGSGVTAEQPQQPKQQQQQPEQQQQQQPVALMPEEEKPTQKAEAKKPIEIIRKQIGKLNGPPVKLECGTDSGQVDLVILLDTSGSIYHTFGNEIALVKSILSQLQGPIADQSLRVSLISFADRTTVAFSLGDALNGTEMITRVDQVQFSGGITHICDAIEKGQKEMDKFGRAGALKVFVLISDGHGHELWPKTMETGKALREQKMQKFAVSMSADYSKDELMAYMGEANRIFVGFRQNLFEPTLLTFLNECLSHSSSSSSSSHTPNNDETTETTVTATITTALQSAEKATAEEPKTAEHPNVQASSDGESSTVNAEEGQTTEGSTISAVLTEQTNGAEDAAVNSNPVTNGTAAKSGQNEQTTNATAETSSTVGSTSAPLSDQQQQQQQQTTLVDVPTSGDTEQMTNASATTTNTTADLAPNKQLSNVDDHPAVDQPEKIDQRNADKSRNEPTDQATPEKTEGSASLTSADQTTSEKSAGNENLTADQAAQQNNATLTADQKNPETVTGNSNSTADQAISEKSTGNANSTADQATSEGSASLTADQAISEKSGDSANSTADQATSEGSASLTADQAISEKSGDSAGDQATADKSADNANSTAHQATSEKASNNTNSTGDQAIADKSADNANSTADQAATNSAADQTTSEGSASLTADQTSAEKAGSAANSTKLGKDTPTTAGEQVTSGDTKDNANATSANAQTALTNSNDNENSTANGQNDVADQKASASVILQDNATESGTNSTTTTTTTATTTTSTDQTKIDKNTADQSPTEKSDNGTNANLAPQAQGVAQENVTQTTDAQLPTLNTTTTNAANQQLESGNNSGTNGTELAPEPPPSTTTAAAAAAANSSLSSPNGSLSGNATSSASVPITEMQNVDDEAKLKMMIMSSLASQSASTGSNSTRSTVAAEGDSSEQQRPAKDESANTTTSTKSSSSSAPQQSEPNTPPALPAVDLVIERPQKGAAQLPFPDSA